MGRLVYVREVCYKFPLPPLWLRQPMILCAYPTSIQDREAEPRFTGAPTRSDFGGAPRGGFGGGGGGGYGGAPGGGGGGRQIYVSNVCSHYKASVLTHV
jgi:hypothetical protein